MFNKTHFLLKFRFLILILVVSLISCNSEIKPITFEATSSTTAYDADISITYDKAIGNNEVAQTINKNIEEAIRYNVSSEDTNTSIESILKNFNLEYTNFKKDFPAASEPVWELHIETELSYQSEAIITIAISTYEFQGGAHGNDTIKFLNLDAKTGEVLKQSDFIMNLSEFEVLAEKHFIRSLEIEEDLKMEDFFFGEPFQLPENIGYSDDGLVLLYNTYEVASYAQGYTEFTIPYKDALPYLKVN